MSSYRVKKILDMRRTGDSIEYLVIWSNTWEPIDRLNKCKKLIENYEKKKKKKNENMAKSRRMAKKEVNGHQNDVNSEEEEELRHERRPIRLAAKAANKKNRDIEKTYHRKRR